jgi:hypothetical protein
MSDFCAADTGSRQTPSLLDHRRQGLDASSLFDSTESPGPSGMLTHFPLNTPLDASMVEESIPPVLHQQRTSSMEDRRPEFGYVATQVNILNRTDNENHFFSANPLSNYQRVASWAVSSGNGRILSPIEEEDEEKEVEYCSGRGDRHGRRASSLVERPPTRRCYADEVSSGSSGTDWESLPSQQREPSR